jgi:hypothetical protein
MVNLITGFPVWKHPSIFFDVAMWEHHPLTGRFLDVAKFTNITTLQLLNSCKLSFPIAGLKIFSLPTLALKSPNRIFVWYLGNLSNTFKFLIEAVLHIIIDFILLGHEHSEQ